MNHLEETIKIKEDVGNGRSREINKRGRREGTVTKWQERWNTSTKGRITYDYFPDIRERLKTKLNTNHYATQYLTENEKLKTE